MKSKPEPATVLEVCIASFRHVTRPSEKNISTGLCVLECNLIIIIIIIIIIAFGYLLEHRPPAKALQVSQSWAKCPPGISHPLCFSLLRDRCAMCFLGGLAVSFPVGDRAGLDVGCWPLASRWRVQPISYVFGRSHPLLVFNRIILMVSGVVLTIITADVCSC